MNLMFILILHFFRLVLEHFVRVVDLLDFHQSLPIFGFWVFVGDRAALLTH